MTWFYLFKHTIIEHDDSTWFTQCMNRKISNTKTFEHYMLHSMNYTKMPVQFVRAISFLTPITNQTSHHVR